MKELAWGLQMKKNIFLFNSKFSFFNRFSKKIVISKRSKVVKRHLKKLSPKRKLTRERKKYFSQI